MSDKTPSKKKKRSFFHTLKFKILAIVIGLVLFSMTVTTIAVITQSKNSLKDLANNQIMEGVSIQAAFIEKWISNEISDIEVIASTEITSSMDPERINPYFNAIKSKNAEFDSLALVGIDGKTIYHTSGKSLDLSDRTHVQGALAGTTSNSDALISKSTGNVIFAIAAPVMVDGEVIGAVTGSISMASISENLTFLELSDTSEAFMVNSAGYMITPSKFEGEFLEQGLIDSRTELEFLVENLDIENMITSKSGVSVYKNHRDVTVVGAYHWLENTQWGIIVEQDLDQALSTARTMVNAVLLRIGISLIIATLLSLWFVNTITNPILLITKAAEKLSLGEVNTKDESGNYDSKFKKFLVILKRKDEIGDISRAFMKLMNYMSGISQAADSIANGDLTINVQPQSEKDVLANAFKNMVYDLRQLMQNVMENANRLNQASSNLKNAAQQSNFATAQMSTVIQQVAIGIAQQANDISNTSNNVDSMTKSIAEVARGAQDQTLAIDISSQITNNMAEIIKQVTNNAQTGSEGASQAGETARDGARTIKESVAGMIQIKEKVDLSAVKVEDMGVKSQEIGTILETIDDIASQTNLLALNAAIEAARAGEHGKGFAVVADEVRKLAERTASATREIDELIKEVQQSVSEAVIAMNESANEVETGVESSNKAGKALEGILSAIDLVSSQMNEIFSAAGNMNISSNELVEAVTSVSTAAVENAGITNQMSENSTEVSRAIENIAAISEENNAAIEEVSAATEEMNAQVEEVTALAEEMDNTAQNLQSLVNQFKIEE
ncbi:MAG: HAMP domain-containing protein [Anaerolineaceae bacterium]|nr:HAMP domain-containing protein [Anaerolineaceae bacterium]